MPRPHGIMYSNAWYCAFAPVGGAVSGGYQTFRHLYPSWRKYGPRGARLRMIALPHFLSFLSASCVDKNVMDQLSAPAAMPYTPSHDGQ